VNTRDAVIAHYDDGVSVGYNTACQLPIYPIWKDWENARYSEGYTSGVSDGILECLNDSGRS
jgi:hypothetical protein